MSLETNYPHLTRASDQTLRIGRSRYKVLHLAAEHFHHGWTAEELMRQHPDLRPEELYAALTYFYDHRDELIAALKRSYQATESTGTAQPLSRNELLARQSNAGR